LFAPGWIAGANGGGGGAAGPAGDVSPGGTRGGAGGRGGHGGDGGGGGGGAGGPSYALFLADRSTLSDLGFTATGGGGGAGGIGGTSRTNAGTPGETGALATGYWQGAFVSDDTPLDVADEAAVSSTIRAPGAPACTAAEAVLHLNLTHGDHAQLAIDLAAPDGTVYVVHDRAAGTGSLAVADRVLTPAPTAVGGAWTLRIQDDAAGETGTLDGWALQLRCTF
ncbi:MAG: proprotein convertase P-domain-containing protein, partial [Deltaproteobacteria bacterium]|nr:proprotein convertase P-domain-containing protein [Deltaproteobacteria bacterium]